MPLRDELRALPSEVFDDLEDVPVTVQYQQSSTAYVPGGEVTRTSVNTPVRGVWLAATGRDALERNVERPSTRFICDGAMLPAGAPQVNDRVVDGATEYEITGWTGDPVDAAPVLDLTRVGG